MMEYPNGSQGLSRYQSYIEAAHRLRSQEVWRIAGMVGRGAAALVRAAFGSLAWLVRRVVKAHRLRMAERKLHELDDRLLDDIGITRGQIETVVRDGRQTQQTKEPGGPRHPHEARRATEVVALRRDSDLMGAIIVHGPWARYAGEGRKRDNAA